MQAAAGVRHWHGAHAGATGGSCGLAKSSRPARQAVGRKRRPPAPPASPWHTCPQGFARPLPRLRALRILMSGTWSAADLAPLLGLATRAEELHCRDVVNNRAILAALPNVTRLLANGAAADGELLRLLGHTRLEHVSVSGVCVLRERPPRPVQASGSCCGWRTLRVESADLRALALMVPGALQRVAVTHALDLRGATPEVVGHVQHHLGGRVAVEMRAVGRDGGGQGPPPWGVAAADGVADAAFMQHDRYYAAHLAPGRRGGRVGGVQGSARAVRPRAADLARARARPRRVACRPAHSRGAS